MTMENLSSNSRIKLSDGNEVPVLGFATYEMDGREAYEAVTWALEAGYRHIESVEWYENEKATGKAILNFNNTSGVPRSDIFYTTKLKSNSGYDHVRTSIKRSLDESELGYIDLYLIDMPLGGTEARQESWRALVDAQKEGLVKSIGISTFGTKHMQEILAMDIGVPAVHQIDLHPFMSRKDIVAFSKKHGMILEAWAPLVRGLRFEHPAIAGLAETYKKEPAQVLLRYSLQKGYIPITMSGSHKRIISNTQIFDFSLSQDDIDTLDGLDEGDWPLSSFAMIEQLKTVIERVAYFGFESC